MIKKIVSIMLFNIMILSLLVVPSQNVQAEESKYALKLAIGYNDAPKIISEVTENGMVHPGVGVTKNQIENLQKQIRQGNEPWTSNFMGLVNSDFGSINYSPRIDKNNTGTPSFTEFTQASQWMNIADYDSKAAYTHALLYVITGDEAYRNKAMQILRLYEQTYASEKHRNYIKGGPPVFKFAFAAELMKYSECNNEKLKWTQSDDEKFKNFLYTCLLYNSMDPQYLDTTTGKFSKLELIRNLWMNQQGFATLQAMCAYIFLDDQEGYAETVEITTVNSKNPDPGLDISIDFQAMDVGNGKYQIAEMGRDQAHAQDDIVVLTELCEIMYSQGTKVDPTNGTISKNENAVNPFEFGDSRLLYAADTWAGFNLGYDIDWVPITVQPAKACSNKFNETSRFKYDLLYDVVDSLSRSTRMYGVGTLYYYYKYLADKKIDVDKKAPYIAEFQKTIYDPSDPGAWDANTDVSQAWIYAPAEAVNDKANSVNSLKYSEARVGKTNDVSETRQIDGICTLLDKEDSSVIDNGQERYVEMTAKQEGTTMAMLDTSFRGRREKDGKCQVAIRVKTDGPAILNLKESETMEPFKSIILPDTNNEWKFVDVDFTVSSEVGFDLYKEDIGILCFEVVGNGAKVGLDYLTINDVNRAPVFDEKEKNIYSYVGQKIDVSLSAKDMIPVEKYSLIDAPDGVNIDEKTGKLSWIPSKEGNYTFYLQAEKGDSIKVIPVLVTVEKDLQSAEDKILEGYSGKDSDYTTESVNSFKAKRDEALGMINNAKISEGLQMLKKSVNELELLTKTYTETLKDGSTLTSIDYLDMVKYTNLKTGYIKTLLDGRKDTGTGDLSSPANYVVIDFGKEYQIKAKAFWIQNRPGFPERNDKTLVYGSNNGLNWDVIIDKNGFEYTKEYRDAGTFEDMHRAEVLDKYQNNGYRYFKIMSGSNPFNTQELRIEGERVENK